MPEPQIISIDYDDTFTSDTRTWTNVINLLLFAGHKVVCVTARQDTPGNRREVVGAMPESVCVLFAYGWQKREFARANGIEVNIWIDDLPEAIPSKRDLVLMCS